METKFLKLIEEFEAPSPGSNPDDWKKDLNAHMWGVNLDIMESLMSAAADIDTYDHRVSSGAPVPPSLTDTLICDIWKLVCEDIDNLSESSIKTEDIKVAFNKYLNLSVDEIAGYRPKAHSFFIKQFKEDELKILADEVVQYIHLNGVRNVKE